MAVAGCSLAQAARRWQLCRGSSSTEQGWWLRWQQLGYGYGGSSLAAEPLPQLGRTYAAAVAVVAAAWWRRGGGGASAAAAVALARQRISGGNATISVSARLRLRRGDRGGSG